MKYAAICLCVFLLLGASGTSVRDSWDPDDLELFAAALAQVGMTPDELRLDVHDREFYGGDKYCLPFFNALIDDPLKISPYTRRLTDELLVGADDLGLTLSRLQNRADMGVRVGLTGDPLAEYRDKARRLEAMALATAVAEFNEDVTPAYYVTDGYYDVPPELRQHAAVLLLVMHDVLVYRRQAIEVPLARLGIDAEQAYRRQTAALTRGEDDLLPLTTQLAELTETELLLETIDLGLLNAGATLLAIAADATASSLAELGPLGEFEYRAHTPLGYVIICGDQHDSHGPPSHPLLLIDTGGLDRYSECGGTPRFDQPLSVVLDLGGNDQYSGGRSSLGSGVFGIGLLLDAGGRDFYQAQDLSLGAGLFGVGILCDMEGDDRYYGRTAVQGSGTYGTGMLIDLAGDDVYECYQYGQGYGFTKGCGLLLDAAGSDTYIANDTDIINPSPQSAEHNASLSQGFGFGRRGDYNDGHSWAGGAGMLIDGGGQDSYSCGVFGQGCAYWYGVGILADKGGGDSYFGQWYCQGSGAHFALGILQDEAGDDAYEGAQNMCVGAGHDFSFGWLEDSAGNDRYTCPNLSLGAANANGIGVFWDKAGDDSYLSRGVTLGMANSVRPGSLRDFILSLGVFIDGGGHDTYLQAMGEGEEPLPWDFAGDGLSWSRPGRADPPLAAEKGCAVDRE